MSEMQLFMDADTMKLFGFWSGVLVLKLVLMVPLTVWQRLRKKVVPNPNDAAFLKGSEVVYNDPDVERVRRSHQNDLENVLPWFLITYVWLLHNPPPLLAGIMIRTFVIARIFHTIFYAVYSQQPLRSITFFTGLIVIIYETVATLIYYF